MKGKQNRPQRPGRRKDSGQNADDDSPPKKRKTHSGTPRPTTPTTPDHKGFVDLFYNFWIQKSHHFYNFWIHNFFCPFLQFLDPYNTRLAQSDSLSMGSAFPCKLDLTEKSFMNRATICFNRIPTEIRQIKKLQNFKIQLKKWILKNYKT